MEDRFSEFFNAAPQVESDDEDVDDGEIEIDSDSDYEEDSSDEEEEDDEEEQLAAFYDQVSSIKSSMAKIRNNIQAIDNLTTQHLADGASSHSDELEALMNETNGLMGEIRNQLKAINEENKDLKNSPQQSAHTRIRLNIHQTLTRRFLDLMQHYQQIQTSYKQNYREQMKRRIDIVAPGKTQEEVDEIIEEGQMEQLMQSKMLDNRREHNQATAALIHIKEQHKDILELEKSIIELHQIFVDMAALVDAQGELIDQIEYNVEQAAIWTGEAVKQLKKANLYQRRKRKKCCCMCAMCAACGAAVAGAAALGAASLLACNIQ
mmetsp:Transcript_28395/g.71312  ORF Transcript_28395/g.71312 Transcript_28395/m.71312 type:complete len:321 (+) Transcript_28395:93-1055(+)|eukprot:CAMPEP_0174233924 /NCGR_PEP_ID=MMETSP0417-20130205/3837_1 /TAXON_ID=242541 /ORGANISM="Mayorella sp, Strain BSH-02190019" /LENGTH=320 /DNA_ID=CAMNT_0015312221 /DNA_START=113 /DNA_END=1075 /DNA_ORIENTATION=-